MNAINEMIHLLDRYGVNQKNSPRLVFKQGSKMAILYQLLKEKKVKNDDEAIHYLYTNDKDSQEKYRKLKVLLRDRLFEEIAQVNFNATEQNDYQERYNRCSRYWNAIKVLIHHEMHTTAILLAEKLIKETISSELSGLTFELLTYLQMQYALREGSSSKWENLRQQYEYYLHLSSAENSIESHYSQFLAVKNNPKSEIQQIQKAVEEAYLYTEEYEIKYNTYKIQLMLRVIKYSKFYYNRQYAESLEICNDAIKYFQTKTFLPLAAFQVFYYQKMYCHIQLGEFSEGVAVLEEAQAYLPPKSFYWYKFKKAFCLLCFRSGEYKKAYDVLISIDKCRSFLELPSKTIEMWKIYQAYIYFIATLKGWPLEGLNFREGKFLNDLPLLSKQKQKFNISIIIVKMLFLLTKRKYNQYIEELDSLRQYSHRYLNIPETQRSKCFLNLLPKIAKHNFMYDELTESSSGYLDRLNSISLSSSMILEESEIIPFEKLWILILENNVHKIKYQKRMNFSY